MDKTTVTLPRELVDELVSLVGARCKREAVLQAIREEIRRRKRDRIRGVAGQLEFDLTADELRHEDHRTGLR
ncbi:MAG: DUF2191 domain-containing protein [Candidatus Dadabacteria bacterium]|nr:MAG: DUF2191 domain-containing protein [Candidatus Dadabacteria bacterium]